MLCMNLSVQYQEEKSLRPQGLWPPPIMRTLVTIQVWCLGLGLRVRLMFLGMPQAVRATVCEGLRHVGATHGMQDHEPVYACIYIYTNVYIPEATWRFMEFCN